MAILGDDDWACSTCFNFHHVDPDEKTEIQVTTSADAYVIALQLLRQDYAQALQSCGSVVTSAALGDWAERQMEAKRDEGAGARVTSLKALRGWERVVMRMKIKGVSRHERPAGLVDAKIHLSIAGSIKVRWRKRSNTSNA